MISSPIRERLFTVAIVGRPNVGKSTLFNRLLGRRLAITDPMPGVTRDAVEGERSIRDLRLRLLDTGGYTLEQGVFDRLVTGRAVESARSCDLILLVVEADRLAGEDLDFIERLRPFQEKLVLVVNKVDGPKQEAAVGELYALGVPRLVAVSATHNRNIAELEEAIYGAAAAAPARAGEGAVEARGGTEAGAAVRMAILGKPNTGKSTLLNLLLDEERSLVSEVPGTTRDPVSGRCLYRGRAFQVVDTAGIRRKSKVEESVEYYSVHRAIETIAQVDVVVLLLDAREDLSEQDKKIASLAARKGRGIILALNKWDLLEAVPNRLEAIRDRVRFLFPVLGFAPVVAVSARTGYGVPRLLEAAVRIGRELNRKVETGPLNRALARWIEQYPPPVRGRNVKVRYGVQVGANPVRFVFFVNTLKGFPGLYRKYLKNRVQEDLGFRHVPVTLEFRQS